MAGPQSHRFDIRKLNLLFYTKTAVPRCDITGLPAAVELVTPYLTVYYASEQYAEQAWYGILHKICHLLGSLGAPAPIVGTEEERQKRDNTIRLSKIALIEVCQSEAAALIGQERFDLASLEMCMDAREHPRVASAYDRKIVSKIAENDQRNRSQFSQLQQIPGALQAYKFGKDVHGPFAVEMVPLYVQLAEANMGLGRLDQAQEYLSFANWNVLSSTGCSHALQYMLYRTLGKLHISKGEIDEAKRQLAKGIFHSAQAKGSESAGSCPGYFLMGNAFLAEGNIEIALAFYDKVVDIWYRYLTSLRNTALVPDPRTIASPEQFTEAEVLEGRDMLTRVFEQRERLLGQHHIATGEIGYTLGLLQRSLGERAESENLVVKALAVYQMHLGPKHPSTIDVSKVLAHLRQTTEPEFKEIVATAPPASQI